MSAVPVGNLILSCDGQMSCEELLVTCMNFSVSAGRCGPSPPDIDGCPPPVRPSPTPAGLQWWRKIVSRNIPSSPVCLPAPHGQHVLTWQSRHFPQSEIFLLSTILFNISHSHSDRKLISSRYRRNIRTNISIFEIFPFQKKQNTWWCKNVLV